VTPLPPRVVRAAVAWALGEPGVGAASAELLAAVSELRRINNYKQEGNEQCLTELRKSMVDASDTL
jgi:hypothetical protein